MRAPIVRRRTPVLLALADLAALLTPPAVAGPAYGGYLFFYFTADGTATGEQVHLAASRGDDPLRRDERNGRRPVLTSSLGDRGVRDPFVIRSPRGDRFNLIATDLRVHGRWQPVANHALPASPRHGTVLPVTGAEPARVRAAFH